MCSAGVCILMYAPGAVQCSAFQLSSFCQLVQEMHIVLQWLFSCESSCGLALIAPPSSWCCCYHFFGHKQMYFWSKADVLLLAIFWFEGNKCGIHQKRSVQKYIVAKEAQTCLKFFDSMTLCSELTGNLLTKKKALFRWKADATAVSSGASI